MRWKTFWSGRKDSMDDGENSNDHRKDITTDFKSTKTPLQHDLLKPFDRDISNLIANIEIRKVNDPGLLKLIEEVKKINNSNKIIVNADKTGNRYEVSVSDYQHLMHDNLTRDYKLDNENKLTKLLCKSPLPHKTQKNNAVFHCQWGRAGRISLFKAFSHNCGRVGISLISF